MGASAVTHIPITGDVKTRPGSKDDHSSGSIAVMYADLPPSARVQRNKHVSFWNSLATVILPVATASNEANPQEPDDLEPEDLVKVNDCVKADAKDVYTYDGCDVTKEGYMTWFRLQDKCVPQNNSRQPGNALEPATWTLVRTVRPQYARGKIVFIKAFPADVLDCTVVIVDDHHRGEWLNLKTGFCSKFNVPEQMKITDAKIVGKTRTTFQFVLWNKTHQLATQIVGTPTTFFSAAPTLTEQISDLVAVPESDFHSDISLLLTEQSMHAFQGHHPVLNDILQTPVLQQLVMQYAGYAICARRCRWGEMRVDQKTTDELQRRGADPVLALLPSGGYGLTGHQCGHYPTRNLFIAGQDGFFSIWDREEKRSQEYSIYLAFKSFSARVTNKAHCDREQRVLEEDEHEHRCHFCRENLTGLCLTCHGTFTDHLPLCPATRWACRCVPHRRQNVLSVMNDNVNNREHFQGLAPDEWLKRRLVEIERLVFQYIQHDNLSPTDKWQFRMRRILYTLCEIAENRARFHPTRHGVIYNAWEDHMAKAPISFHWMTRLAVIALKWGIHDFNAFAECPLDPEKDAKEWMACSGRSLEQLSSDALLQRGCEALEGKPYAFAYGEAIWQLDRARKIAGVYKGFNVIVGISCIINRDATFGVNMDMHRAVTIMRAVSKLWVQNVKCLSMRQRERWDALIKAPQGVINGSLSGLAILAISWGLPEEIAFATGEHGTNQSDDDKTKTLVAAIDSS
jgi:hypothetical protein